ncbi:DUF1016 N-terminal domain-containing protein [Nitrosomonas communis]|uniref:DUF1016 N-terminal domain-containing protein n=1 Tax=Nitrosomonas communis TaxID=44574 RepID=UPI0026F1A591|nr:DUF1016 N-terminal domain-containing protein [Nitrosomonas communis]
MEWQAQQGWGAKVIEQLAHDLRMAFPEMKGFSPCNLKYMHAFAEVWPDSEFVQAVLAQLPITSLCCWINCLRKMSVTGVRQRRLNIIGRGMFS